ncbi:MAG: efflux RND transporter permease subunit, partial [Clostridia bacterium]
MNVAKFAVSRPITVWMAVFVAVLLGFFSLTRLPIDLLPEMNIPIAAVATSYEGAGPQEVESLVTRPIEEAMSSLANVTGVSSTSARGQSVVL